MYEDLVSDETDVVVMGAGINGLVAAAELAASGPGGIRARRLGTSVRCPRRR